jgi:hypothetical protein
MHLGLDFLTPMKYNNRYDISIGTLLQAILEISTVKISSTKLGMFHV